MVAALDHLIGRGLIARESGRWQLRRPVNEIDLAVPEGLREMIEVQIERLSPEEQRVLEVASLTQDRAFSVIARAAAAMDADTDQFEKVFERPSRRTHILRPGTLELTLATAERTWQALAWDTSARVAMAERDFHRAQHCVDRALATMEGFEVPLAAWRVHRTAAELYSRERNHAAAGRHRALGGATVLTLANSLADDERLRDTFRSAAPVRGMVDPGREARTPSGRPTPPRTS